MGVFFIRRLIISISTVFTLCCPKVKAQIVLYKCTPIYPFVEEILWDIKKVEPTDTTYWDSYYLSFHQFMNDVSCSGGILCQNDYFFPDSDSDKYGYFKWNNRRVIIEGTAASHYFERSQNDSIVFPYTLYPSFAEYTGKWPQYWIVNNKLQKKLNMQDILRVLDESIDYLKSNNELADHQYTLKVSQEKLDDSLSVVSQDLLKNKAIANVYEDHIKAYLRLYGKDKEICQNILEVSNIQHGVFFIDLTNEKGKSRFYFYVVETESYNCKILLKEHHINHLSNQRKQ